MLKGEKTLARCKTSALFTLVWPQMFNGFKVDFYLFLSNILSIL